MKYLLLIFFLLYTITSIKSQPKIKKGKPYSAVQDEYRAYIPYGDQILTLKSTKKIVTFYKINPNNLNSTLVGEFQLPKNVQNFERVLQLGKKHYAFFTLQEKQTLALYAGEIDLDKGNFVGDLKHIYSTDNLYFPPTTYLSNQCVTELKGAKAIALWDFKTSPDKDKLLITKYHYSDANVLFALFDQNLEKVWEKTIDELPSNLDKKNVTIKLGDYNTDADGNLYVSTLAYNSNVLNMSYKVELAKISTSGQISLIPIDIGEERRPLKIWLEEGNDKQLKAIIAYSNNSSTTKKVLINGIFIGDIENNKVINTSYEDWNPSFYQFVNKVGNQFYGVATYTCDLEQVIREKNGSLIYLFEFRHDDIEKSLINLKDNMLMKVNPDGKIAWIKTLPKNHQKGFKIAESKYKYCRGENNHYVLFMDAPQNNKDYDLESYAKKYKTNTDGVLAFYKINDNSGKITKHQILETNPQKLSRLYMNKISQISDSKLIIEAFHNKKEEILIEVKLY